MPMTLTRRAWIVRDKEGGGYIRETEDGTWSLVASASQATQFDNQPEAWLTGVAYFPTLFLETVPVKN